MLRSAACRLARAGDLDSHGQGGVDPVQQGGSAVLNSNLLSLSTKACWLFAEQEHGLACGDACTGLQPGLTASFENTHVDGLHQATLAPRW